MRQKIGRAGEACTATGRYCLTKVLGVPIDNDGGTQVEAGHAIVLALDRAVADFALASDAQSVIQGMVRLALVQPDLGAALHIEVTGRNTHHMVEACFKSVGRALRQAIQRDGTELPSTKGTLS